MGWNKLDSRPTKGQKKVIIKLPINIILTAMFTDGELSVYDQINDRYVEWDQLKAGIEWKPVPT
ncbi:MAG: hypothetical protein PVF82_17550 [Gammaproteobacteria bacterium]|jgi:hypothetical protein